VLFSNPFLHFLLDPETSSETLILILDKSSSGSVLRRSFCFLFSALDNYLEAPPLTPEEGSSRSVSYGDPPPPPQVRKRAD
jgi:hypothetical protein